MASFATFFHGELTGLEITCIQSFLDHGHDVTIFAYEKCGAPTHFKIADAEKILRRTNLFFYKSSPGRGSVSGFTNRFRYALLQHSDDWWIDTDVVCLSKEWPSAGAAPIHAAWEDDKLIGSAVLRLDPAVAKALYERAKAIGAKAKWGETGPRLLTSYAQDHHLLNKILPAQSFYPIHYNEWQKIFAADSKDSVREACRSSHAVHLWNEMSRRAGFDKSALPQRDSFFGSLVALHGTQRFFNAA